MNFLPGDDVPRELVAAKRETRKAARGNRDAARVRCPGAPRLAAAHALEFVGALRDLGRVAGYLPIGSELDPLPLLLALHGFGVPLCLPVVVAPDAALVFRPWVPGSATARSSYGVEEPVAGAAVVPDLLLVPLLAFDDRCHRLGYGGGYYDRTLAALSGSGSEARTIGYAYAAQRLETVPVGEVDARLDAIVTERGVVRPA